MNESRTCRVPVPAPVNHAAAWSIPHDLGNEVELWLVDLLAERAAWDAGALSCGEHRRAARFASSRDAGRYLAARHALRRLLGRALHVLPDSLEIEADVFGKPRLIPDRGLYFSVSRSGDCALIGISRRCLIGVDVEVRRPVRESAALAAFSFTQEEFETWSGRRASSDCWFLTCWTRKEAAVKALGVGLSMSLQGVDAGCQRERRRVSVRMSPACREIDVLSVALPIDAFAAVALVAPRESPVLLAEVGT